MKQAAMFLTFFVLLALCAGNLSLAAATAVPDHDLNQLEEPMYRPLIERYILDELKQLRQDNLNLRTELTEKYSASRLDAADRAVRYTADTTTTIFYIITATASVLVLLGWRSISDIRSSIESTTSSRVLELTQEYENRLNALEQSLIDRTEQIVTAQREISDTNYIHSLWMRAALEKSELDKIKIYDQILEISNNDVEALTYKADALLDIDEDTWALSLTDQAIENDNEYALAYWQRACAHAKLEQYDSAIVDIKKAVSLSASLKDEISSEIYFANLQTLDAFQELLQ